ncbi:MAG: carboxypeptidase regulatory-like domain-containing protein [Candidatus Methanoperedens sp.]|nr:carboxypeptidase regulatory-like domain-containing protein [Candidatus Methanoperedens sp.]
MDRYEKMDIIISNLHLYINEKIFRTAFFILISSMIVLSIPAITVSADPQIMDVWSYGGNVIPEPANTSWVHSTLTEKSAIFFIDSNRFETKLTSGHDQFDFQMYRFYISEPAPEITNLTSNWTGYGEIQTGYDTYLYIWNNQNFSWEQLDRKHLTTDGNLNGSIMTNITDYVDINGFVHITAASRHYNYAPPAPMGLSVLPGYTDATISWLPAHDQDNDIVEYYAEIVGVANSGWISGTSWYYSGLINGSSYIFRVKSRDTFSNSESPFSILDFSTPASCPFVYIWNGTNNNYTYVTDLYGSSIGVAAIPIKNRMNAFYDIDFIDERFVPKDGKYSIHIRESLGEADYFDYAKLMIVDVPEGYRPFSTWHGYSEGAGFHISNGIRYNYTMTSGFDTVHYPRTADYVVDKYGRNTTFAFSKVDDIVGNESLDRMNYYTMDFGRIEHPEYAKLIVYGWMYATQKPNDKETGLPPTTKIMEIEVINQSGQWQKVGELGRMMGDLRPAIYNISNIWLTNDRRIRMHGGYTATTISLIDKIEFDDSAPVDINITIVNASSAILKYTGRDDIQYLNLEHSIIAPNTLAKDIFSAYYFGNFTKYGDVTPLLNSMDDMYAIIRHGDELDLEFPEVEVQSNKSRKIFLDAFVWYKVLGKVAGGPRDDSTFLLPFMGMKKYPYNISVENYPYDDEHNQYLREWNTRICEDRVNATCYDSTTGDQIIHESENALEKPLPRSLNTNYVDLEPTYKPGYNVSGYVTDISSGLPISGVFLQTNFNKNTTTNASGFYNFSLKNSTYNINASKFGYGTNSTTVTVNGGDITNVNIKLVYHQSDISGYIIDESNGLPLSDVIVKVANTQLNMTTGADGFYSFTLIDGEHSLVAILQNYAINSITVTINSANITNANISLSSTQPQGRDASHYAGNNIPVPYNDSWIHASSTQKGAISYIDSDRWKTNLTTGLDQFDYQMYHFYVMQPNIHEVKNLTAKWIGHGENKTGYDTYLYIWNYNNVSWEQLDNKNLGVDGTLEKSITTNVGQYVDINGYVHVGAGAKHSDYSPPSPFGLNTNYVELKVNDLIIGNSIFNVNSTAALSYSYITWNNDIFPDNRVYYGLNETDVNNLVNGSWSDWVNNSMNPAIRLTGLTANTTYYYRPLTWYLGTVNNSMKSRVFSTAKTGVWVNPAESMVSPAGWIGSPANFRTINISAAPLDSNGRYISDLSLEARVYNNSGLEIGRVNLIGTGPYYANFILPDYFSDERGYVKIANYSMVGEFSVLKWSCVNCHMDGERYPSSFNSATVHSTHTNTKHSMTCESSCHDNYDTNFVFLVSHSASTNMNYDYTSAIACNNNCHKQDLTCNECHNDVKNSWDVSNTSVLSVMYGKDVHLNKQSCTDCHGGLTSINPSPSCTTCHPRPDSNLTTVPGSIETRSHSNKQTVACGLCHNSEHDIKSLTMDAKECKNCHPGIIHNNGAQCTTCHGNDPHEISAGGCIECHSFSDTRYFVNNSLFGRHANVNKSDGSNNLSDDDCKACHFGSADGSMNMELGAANETNTYFCQDCHTSNGRRTSQFNNLTDENLRKMPMPPGHGNNGCPKCHIVGADKTRPLTKELRYHSYGPKGFSD